MKSFRSGILITSMGVLLTFLSVVYISCQKAELNPLVCQDLICRNGGYCYSDTALKSLRYGTHYCKCPASYTGDSCTITVNQKFVGNWNVTEALISSNNHAYSWSASYTASIVGNTAHGFFINNFRGNSSFSEVGCVVDTNAVDTFGNNFNFFPEFTPIPNPNFHITGGMGSVPVESATETYPLSMSGVYYTNWENDGYQGGYVPQTDTISFTMTR
jgi:hypothetical protein